MTTPSELIALALEGLEPNQVAERLETLAIYAVAQIAELQGDDRASAFAWDLAEMVSEHRLKARAG